MQAEDIRSTAYTIERPSDNERPDLVGGEFAEYLFCVSNAGFDTANQHHSPISNRTER